MNLIAIISILFTASALVVGARAVAMPRLNAVRRLKEISAYGFTGDIAVAPIDDEEDDNSLLGRLADEIGKPMLGRLREEKAEELRRHLRAAGYYTAPVERFLGYRALFAGTLSLSIGWIIASASLPTFLKLVIVLYGGVLAWMGPMIILKGRGRRRLEEVDRQLPDLIELLVVTVEAGLGFSASLRMATRRIEGALGDELRLAVQEQQLGVDLRESMQNMLMRADSPAMRSFVRALDQGQSMGVSVGTIMRNLAVEMRKRRRQNIEERAQKAPIKMLFPLIFVIFPAMLLLLGYPVVRGLLQAFGGN